MSAISSAAILLPLILVQTFTTVISGYVVKYTGYTKSSFVVGFVFWFAGQTAQLCFGRSTSVGVIVGVLLVQGMGVGATLQSEPFADAEVGAAADHPTPSQAVRLGARLLGLLAPVLTPYLAALVLAQASGVSTDRAVVTGARKCVPGFFKRSRRRADLPSFSLSSFARTSGGAIGLAIGNAVLNNVFSASLPASIPAALKAELKKDFVLPAGLSAQLRDEILDAYMKGIKDVFILFIPIVGLCLIMCLFIKVGSLPPRVRALGSGLTVFPHLQDICLLEPTPDAAASASASSGVDVEKGGAALAGGEELKGEVSGGSGTLTPTTLCESPDREGRESRKGLHIAEK